MKRLVIVKILDGTGQEQEELIRCLSKMPDIHEEYLFFVIPSHVSMESLTIEQAEELHKFLGEFLSDQK